MNGLDGRLRSRSNRRQFLRVAAGTAGTAILIACGERLDTPPAGTLPPVGLRVFATSALSASPTSPTIFPNPPTISPSTPAATSPIALMTPMPPTQLPTATAPTPASAMAQPALTTVVPTPPAIKTTSVPTAGMVRRDPATPLVTASPSSPGTLSGTFFGMHIHRAATTTAWPVVPFGTWRLWDAQVAWFDLEPRRGEWHFETLDKYVALAEEHGVELLLPLGFSPAWASARPDEASPFYPSGASAEPQDLEDWQHYVATVGARYKGRIRNYEVWNEPNLRQYWTGPIRQLLTLTQTAYLTLKDIDPSVTIVGPSVTSSETGLAWLGNYFAKGGSASLDVIAHHFYVFPGSPEALVPFIDSVRQIMTKYGVRNKPLWNTEITWALPATFPVAADAAAYLARAYLLNASAGVQRCYWYAWDDREWSTLWLTEADEKKPTLAGLAYGELQQWLVDRQMVSCTVDRANTYVCQLVREGNASEWVLWNPYQTLSYTLPDAWHIVHTRDLTGATTELRGETHVPIGPLPLLLRP